MNIKLLTEHYLEFLSLKGSCTGSSESTLVKMPHRWKSHVAAHFLLQQKANDIFFGICSTGDIRPTDYVQIMTTYNFNRV